MVHAKNYDTASKFVKVMPRILWPLFFPRHGVYITGARYLNSCWLVSIQSC